MKKVTLIILSLFYITTNFAQAEWELKKEDDGVKVYTREIEGSSLKAFKAEAVMKGKLSSFVAVLQDVESYIYLFNDMTEATLIEITDTFHIHVTETNVPWPVDDRYGVYSNSYSQRYDHKTVTVKVNALEGYTSDRKGKVRITKAKGQWTIHPVGDDNVDVTFEMHVEPGGSVPTWMINMFLVDTPLKDMKTLRERVMLPQYQNKEFDFLVEY